MDERKVPLQVAWLQETGLLVEAGQKFGWIVNIGSADKDGVQVLFNDGKWGSLIWTDSLLFTLAQLAELGFALGNKTFLISTIHNQELLDSVNQKKETPERKTQEVKKQGAYIVRPNIVIKG